MDFRHYPAPDLLGDVLSAVVLRRCVDSSLVGRVTGGCVNSVGQQSGNVTRKAWLGAGLDQRVGTSTIPAACGSTQQAFTLDCGWWGRTWNNLGRSEIEPSGFIRVGHFCGGRP